MLQSTSLEFSPIDDLGFTSTTLQPVERVALVRSPLSADYSLARRTSATIRIVIGPIGNRYITTIGGYCNALPMSSPPQRQNAKPDMGSEVAGLF